MNINQGIAPKRGFLNLRKRRGDINPGLRNYIPGRRHINVNASSISSLSTEQLRKFSTPWISSTSGSMKTPGSSERTPQSSSSTHYVIIALCEGRGEAREEIGIAVIDIRRPELIIYQVSDTQGYEKTMATINMLNPTEIIVPLTIYESRLVTILKKRFQYISINSISRRLFDANIGLQLIQHLCAKTYSNTLLNIQHKYYALAATSALINHLENSKYVSFASKSLKISYLRIDNLTAIDCDTAYRLELVSNTQGSNKYGSLFGILNKCITNGGRRLLRANILQPLCRQNEIEKRLDSVEELKNSPEILKSLQFRLPQFVNVDCILTLSMKTLELQNHRTADININYILLLKAILAGVPTLVETISSTRSSQFNKIIQDLSKVNYERINEVILRVIQKDAVPCKGYMGEMQRCFSVKPGVNQYMDLIRQKFSNLIEKAQILVEKDLTEKYNLPLTLNYSGNRSYHILLKLAPHQRKMKPADLPSEFINVTKHPNSFTMTTIKLVQLNRRIKDIQTELELLSAREINYVLSEIREEIGSLYRLCECIAELDLIQSLAEIAKIPNYVRPTFSLNFLEVVSARHPVLEFLMEDEPVANNISSSIYRNFNIITGPNMSGKSIYIKQVALLHIMAQLGSFVPASKACIRITNRIFTRINFDDCIECDASTFQLDIREMKSIIDSLTPSSLVIIDEICRGTTHDEGTAVAWTLCEQFLDTTAFVFVATHYLTLTKLEDLYFNVTNWHLDSHERQVNNEIRLSHTHRLLNGVTKIENYGIAAARASAIPKCIVDRASEILKQLLPSAKPLGENEDNHIIDRVKYDFVAKVKYLQFRNELNNEILDHLINDYKNTLQKFKDNNQNQNENSIFSSNCRTKERIITSSPCQTINSNQQKESNVSKIICSTENSNSSRKNTWNVDNNIAYKAIKNASINEYPMEIKINQEHKNILTSTDQTSSSSYHYLLPNLVSTVYSNIQTSTSEEMGNVDDTYLNFNQNFQNNIFKKKCTKNDVQFISDQNLKDNNIYKSYTNNIPLVSNRNLDGDNIYENYKGNHFRFIFDQNLKNNSNHRNGIRNNVEVASNQNLEDVNFIDYRLEDIIRVQNNVNHDFGDNIYNEMLIPSTSLGNKQTKIKHNSSKTLKRFKNSDISFGKNHLNASNSTLISTCTESQCNKKYNKNEINTHTIHKENKRSNRRRFLKRSDSESILSIQKLINVKKKQISKSSPNLIKLYESSLNKNNNNTISKTSTSVSIVKETFETTTLKYKIQAKQTKGKLFNTFGSKISHLFSDENSENYKSYLNSIERYTPKHELLSLKYIFRSDYSTSTD